MNELMKEGQFIIMHELINQRMNNVHKASVQRRRRHILARGDPEYPGLDHHVREQRETIDKLVRDVFLYDYLTSCLWC